VDTASRTLIDLVFGPPPPPSPRYTEVASMIVYLKIAGAPAPSPQVHWQELAHGVNPTAAETLEARALATLMNGGH
jgi:hypothetical protein